MKTNCAIYCRGSTDVQEEAKTIEAQLQLLPKYAKEQGWNIFKIYKDDGYSGETWEGNLIMLVYLSPRFSDHHTS